MKVVVEILFFADLLVNLVFFQLLKFNQTFG